jgi:hypothetical protein
VRRLMMTVEAPVVKRRMMPKCKKWMLSIKVYHQAGGNGSPDPHAGFE